MHVTRSRRTTVVLAVVRVARRLFRGRSVQQNRMTTWLYRRVMRASSSSTGLTEINFRGASFLLPATDVTIVPSLMLGDYETTALQMFMLLVGDLESRAAVLDVGANVGVYSVLAARSKLGKGTVYAFEPVSANIALLEGNLARNGITSATIVPKAVGASPGSLRIYLSREDAGTHSAGGQGNDFQDVAMITLDDFARRRNIIVGAIKIDVEGYDGFVLEGAKALIRAQEPMLLVEYTPAALEQCGYAVDRFCQTLFSLPGVWYWVDERHACLTPLREPRDLYGIQWNRASSSNILVTKPSALLLPFLSG